MGKKADLLQGTLHLLILKALSVQELHGLGVANRIAQITNGTFEVKPGSLFPALHRMEEFGWLKSNWGDSENNRRRLHVIRILAADQGRLGKAIGADLKEGKRTLPLIATLERAAPAERDRIQSVLKRHSGDPGEIEDIRQLVERYGGVEYALGRARAYAQSAKEALAGFSSSDDKDTLLLIADFVVARDR